MKSLLSYMINTFMYIISGFVPKKKNRVIIGSWFGEKYNDNSKYLAEHLCQSRPDLEIIWSGKPHLKEIFMRKKNIKFVEMNTLKCLTYAITAKYVFVTQSFRDIYKYDVFNNAIKFQLWHGIPLKLIGDDRKKNDKKRNKFKMYGKYDYFIASSDENKEKIISAFKSIGANEKNVLLLGSPRNDFLYNNKNNNSLVLNIKSKIPKLKDKFVITYMPTFRDNSNNVYSILEMVNSNDEFKNWLIKNNVIVIEKKHFINEKYNKNNEKEFYLNVSEDIDTQELLLITDILITDYSSCYFDFTLLNRPIIHFVYDYDEYKNQDRGLYYDLEDVKGGYIVYEERQLVEAIINAYKYYPIESNESTKVVERFLSEEKGHAAKKISEKYICW
jgi:CDP-glycerol glycerophosphotransferase (TagB/SpsB family)